ncbi:MAG: ABC transporter substrate-binding protein [Clostridia bacterium]|nr:ABC transporter substrate-binding protein [Clostridia bacterium]
MNKLLRGKTLIALLLSVLLALSVAGCGGTQQGGQGGEKAKSAGETKPANEAKKPYKVGLILDITGKGSALGVPERNTLKMLVEEQNAKGGINGHLIELVLYDNESDEMKSVIGAKKLINEDKVAVIIGSSQSGTTMSMVDTVTKAQIPLVSLASSAKIVTPPADRKWIFKTPQNDSLVAEKIGEYLVEKNLKKVASIKLNNAFGDSAGAAFQEVAQAKGITILAEEKIEAADKDFTSQLTRIKAVKPDAVVVWSIPPSASILTSNYRQMKMEMPLIFNHGIGQKAFIDMAGEAANGVMFPIGKILVAEALPDSDPQKQVILDFVKSYEAKFGSRTTHAGHAWDAFQLVRQAMEKAGDDPAKIRDELENTKNFVGIHGVFNMSTEDHSGLRKDDLVFVRIENGKWVPAEKLN